MDPSLPAPNQSRATYGLEVEVWQLEFGVAGCTLPGVGFRAEDLGFRVEVGSRFRDHMLD